MIVVLIIMDFNAIIRQKLYHVSISILKCKKLRMSSKIPSKKKYDKLLRDENVTKSEGQLNAKIPNINLQKYSHIH